MISAKLFAKYAADPAAFRADLQVDCDGQVKRLGEVMDPWQREDFAALDPGLTRSNGRSDQPAKMRAYLERPRGHSKTTDIAIVCIWALAFAARPIRAYAFAADQDQAALLKDAMATVIRLNPWLAFLEVQKDQVINTAAKHPGQGAKLEIYTSDVASSYGILADLIVADELCHWQGDGSLWHSLISSAAKRDNCLMLVISNAGFVDSWQWEIREAARTDPAWHFSRLDGPQASWLSPERLAEQRRMLPAMAFARLWENLWSAGGGDALTPADIDAAFLPELQPMTGGEHGWLFVGGLDLGLKRDGSSVVILAVPSGGRAGRIRLAFHRLWRPPPGGKIDLIEVERTLLDLDRRYNLEAVGFDPWQAESMMQRCEVATANRRRSQQKHFGLTPWARELAPTAQVLRDQATLVVEAFQDRRLQLFPCGPLERDLRKVRAEEKSYGLRLTSPRDQHGHSDSFSALANALTIAHEYAGKIKRRAGAVGVIGGGGSPADCLDPSFASMRDNGFLDALRTGNCDIRTLN